MSNERLGTLIHRISIVLLIILATLVGGFLGQKENQHLSYEEAQDFIEYAVKEPLTPCVQEDLEPRFQAALPVSRKLIRAMRNVCSAERQQARMIEALEQHNNTDRM